MCQYRSKGPNERVEEEAVHPELLLADGLFEQGLLILPSVIRWLQLRLAEQAICEPLLSFEWRFYAG